MKLFHLAIDQASSRLRKKKGHLPSTYVDARKLFWYTCTSPPNLLGLDNNNCEIRIEIIS
jgi:hypothetical protein